MEEPGEIDSQNGEELHGCGATLACDPRRHVHRYLVLIIMCFLSFGKCSSEYWHTLTQSLTRCD